MKKLWINYFNIHKNNQLIWWWCGFLFLLSDSLPFQTPIKVPLRLDLQMKSWFIEQTGLKLQIWSWLDRALELYGSWNYLLLAVIVSGFNQFLLGGWPSASSHSSEAPCHKSRYWLTRHGKAPAVPVLTWLMWNCKIHVYSIWKELPFIPDSGLA